MLVYLQAIDCPDDQAKFEQLYLRYRAYMFKIANKILHNEQDAEDAVHNAFLSIAKNISKISDPESPKTQGYLVIIIERKAIDLYRERKAHPHEELDAYDPGITAPELADHDLLWCISQLPPNYREMILLKYSHGYTTREIADLLDLSFYAASKLDQRAKKKLLELCREEGVL